MLGGTSIPAWPIHVHSVLLNKEQDEIPFTVRINGLGTNKNLVMGSDGARNHERLCWPRPAALYCFVLPIQIYQVSA
jgi:hypothetical protein